jgi:hypothetical protein
MNNTSLVKQSCSTKYQKKMNEKEHEQARTSSINESTPFIKNSILPRSIISNMDKQISPLLHDHDLSIDPSKWTVYHVQQFIGRITDDTIAETFYKK